MHKETEKFGLLIYNTDKDTYNIGDYIQSIAAKQFLPEVDVYINREALNKYEGEPVKIILNGWFLHNTANWPPSNKIIPLFTSFHLTPLAFDILNKDENIEYFKKNGPIGCRDTFTYNILLQKGISVYLSYCLTLTLKRERKFSNKILFVDVLANMDSWRSRKIGIKILIQKYKILTVTRLILNSLKSYNILSERTKIINKLFDKKVLKDKVDIFHERNSSETEKERFEIAEKLIQEYCDAKLVVTSRLHCALPCLAFGTPVIFITNGLENEFDTTRISDYISFFDKIVINKNLFIYHSNNLKIKNFSGKELINNFVNFQI